MTVDDESIKAATQTAAGGLLLAALVAIGKWFWDIGGLPRRVQRVEGRVILSDRLQLAQADFQLASSAADKREAKERLREARDAMLDGILKEGKKK